MIQLVLSRGWILLQVSGVCEAEVGGYLHVLATLELGTEDEGLLVLGLVPIVL